MKKILSFFLLVAVLMPCAARAGQDIAVSVAVLPFESFSGEQKTSVGRDAAFRLLQQLAANPLIVTPDIQDMKALMAKDDAGTPSEDRLRDVARQLKVNFLLFGSVTSVNEAHSIDAQVFYNFPGDNYFKTYAEGPELDKVIEALARKIEQELLDKASLIPAAQRPATKKRRVVPPVGVPSAAEYEKAVNSALAAEEEIEDAEARRLKVSESEELDDLVEDTPAKRPASKSKKHKKPTEELEGINQQGAQAEKGSKTRDEGDSKNGSLPLKLNQPVNISSDALEYSNTDNSAIFRGNVVARQGDMVMFADQMQATYAGKVGGGGNEKGGIKEIVATGNVKIMQGERIATGQKIVFYGDEQKIVASGNPRVWQGKNVIAGSKITVYLKSDRSIVEGTTKDRVSATIYSKENKGNKK